MKQAIEFLKEHYEVAFATSEDNKPKIRIFQIMKIEEATLYFATSPVKDVYKQLIDYGGEKCSRVSGGAINRIIVCA